MTKLQDYDFVGTPPQVRDFKDDVQTILNNGKYQIGLGTNAPTWNGRAGETFLAISGGSGRLYICATDNSSAWTSYIAFTAV